METAFFATRGLQLPHGFLLPFFKPDRGPCSSNYTALITGLVDVQTLQNFEKSVLNDRTNWPFSGLPSQGAIPRGPVQTEPAPDGVYGGFDEVAGRPRFRAVGRITGTGGPQSQEIVGRPRPGKKRDSEKLWQLSRKNHKTPYNGLPRIGWRSPL